MVRTEAVRFLLAGVEALVLKEIVDEVDVT
jgi:hypothetical protein